MSNGSSAVGFDPITLEIYWNRLVSIAEEQAQALIHNSFTTAVAEMEDLACAIYDTEGNLVAQAITGTQGILVGMSVGLKHMLRRFPLSALVPGDILACNDPWMFTGHKYDIAVATPVFMGAKPIGLVSTVLHGADIGGIGSPNDSTSVHEEGLSIPIVKLFKAGEPNQELLDLIADNVRVPNEVIGDLMAQVQANEVSAHRLIEFMQENNLSDLSELSRAILTATEKAVRDAVSELSDGVYQHEVWMDGIEEPLKVAATLSVKGDDLHIDFSGTSPQTKRGGINSVFNFTLAYAGHAIKSALVPDVPNNDGLFRSIRVSAPEGSLVNPRRPAPVTARYMMVSPISSAVFGALAKVVPQRVVADSTSVVPVITIGETAEGKNFVQWMIPSGGSGACPHRDGYSATSYAANVGNVPVEIMENVSPLFVVKREIVTDSGGPGKFRGGCDQRTTFTIRGDARCIVHNFVEKTAYPCCGYFGGMDGGRAGVLFKGQAHHPKEKAVLRSGDELTFNLGGGGGFHPPEQRDPDKVLWDVINGYVSVQAAEQHYKVAVDAAKKCIDWERTNALRGGG